MKVNHKKTALILFALFLSISIVTVMTIKSTFQGQTKQTYLAEAKSNPPAATTSIEDKSKTASIVTTTPAAPLHVKGIYITQYSFENTAFLNYLIRRAQASGIDTFIVDMEIPSRKYKNNLALLKESGINYVARIIMFPDGGTQEMIKNPAYWQRKFPLVQQAIDWGAKEIQLDYIRYSSKEKADPQHAKDIYEIIQWYKNKVSQQNIPLQIDVFGIASFGESQHIGQNIKLFSETVDAVCPMVYPSHYVPFDQHFKTPFETVFNSLTRIQKLFGPDKKMPIKMYAWIELSNYHFPMSREKTLDYIKAQVKAVKDSGADGWFAWSPHNRYDNLFDVLENKPNPQVASENKK